MKLARQVTRSEIVWAAAILAVSGALYALTGRDPSAWNLATGYIIVRALILVARD